MTHTPGPWTIGEAGNTGEAFCITAETRDICWTSDSTGTEDDGTGLLVTEEDKANARLIAAAPEMLAALRVAKTELIDMYERLYPADESDNDTTIAIDAVIAAIAKAEGRGE